MRDYRVCAIFYLGLPANWALCGSHPVISTTKALLQVCWPCHSAGCVCITCCALRSGAFPYRAAPGRTTGPQRGLRKPNCDL